MMLYVILAHFYIYVLSRSTPCSKKWERQILQLEITTEIHQMDDSIHISRAQEKMSGAVRILKSIVRHIKEKQDFHVTDSQINKMITKAKKNLERVEGISDQRLEVQKEAVKLHCNIKPHNTRFCSRSIKVHRGVLLRPEVLYPGLRNIALENLTNEYPGKAQGRDLCS